MKNPKRKTKTKTRTDLEGLPTLEELQRTVPMDKLLYGYWERLDGDCGEEISYVKPPKRLAPKPVKRSTAARTKRKPSK